jgi:hypothetical protein
MLSTDTALLLFALTLIGLWLVSWSRRVGARHARAKAEEEARILAALVDVSRYAGQPVDRLKEVLGVRCRYSSFDFGAFSLEWDIGQVQVIAWCRENECESMEIRPRSN